MTKPKRLVLQFPDSETRADFVGWFLDGGGEQSFSDYCSLQDAPQLTAGTVLEGEDWDWETKGETAEEHVIAMTVVDSDAEPSE